MKNEKLIHILLHIKCFGFSFNFDKVPSITPMGHH